MRIYCIGLILSFFILYPNLVSGQTIGVTLHTEASLDGYTFFSPFSGTKAYLVDNCGKLINEWNRGTRPGLSAYFLENGLMMRTYKVSPSGPFTSASNAGGLELVDWNNNVVWTYEINTTEWLSHHDAVMMPNGNILMLTWELVYRDELIELGRDPNEIAPQNFMWSEKIIEVEPIGTNNINILWEWNIKDHYIQDFDDSKLGFGVIDEHPELFDINLPELNSPNSNSSRDWNHFNAIDYNPDLDQILISVRNSDEVWILDHSTTTEEAKGHSGGIYGKGGDILYRWGNGSAYKRAAVSEQKLFGQHGVNWIPQGMEDAGKILIYNNGNGRPGVDYSTVEIISPPQSAPGHYIVPETSAFGPTDPDWTYGDLPGQQFYSPYLSNAQRLENGNTLINAGSPGLIFEINKYNNKDWQYIIPLNGDTPANQGQTPFDNGNFRAYKFSSEYVGFEGLNLNPGQPIENNPVACNETTSIINLENTDDGIFYNGLDHSIRIKREFKAIEKARIFDSSGKLVASKTIEGQDIEWALPPLKSGIYFCHWGSKPFKFFVGF